MKRNLMTGLAAIVIVVVVIVAGAIMLLGQNGKVYTPKVGDFLEYSYSDHFESRNLTNTVNVTYEILGVNATSFYYKATLDTGYSYYYNSTKNATFFDWDLSYYKSWNITFLDQESINTKWGAVSTDHYNVTTDFGEWGDWWIRNDFVMKYVMVSSGGDMTNTCVLIDTNISQVTG
jgi:hypothetical protein